MGYHHLISTEEALTHKHKFDKSTNSFAAREVSVGYPVVAPTSDRGISLQQKLDYEKEIKELKAKNDELMKLQAEQKKQSSRGISLQQKLDYEKGIKELNAKNDELMKLQAEQKKQSSPSTNASHPPFYGLTS